MKVLILDGYNLLHRARSGWMTGDHAVTFMFFRSLRPIIEKFAPDKVYFVLEGTPKKRIELDSDYKANRKIDESDPKYQSLMEFLRQKDECVDLLSEAFPFTLSRHPDFEADDIIAHYARYHKDDDVTIVSADSDFIQLLTEDNPHIKIYHPIKKEYVTPPDYNYLHWKAIRGDATDNIPGIPRHGDKTAEKIVRDPKLLLEKMSDKAWKDQFYKNLSLIRIDPLTRREESEILIKESDFHPDAAKEKFQEWEFSFATKEVTWEKYVKTLECLT